MAGRHEDECQAQGQSVKREGDGKEGEEQWSSSSVSHWILIPCGNEFVIFLQANKGDNW